MIDSTPDTPRHVSPPPGRSVFETIARAASRLQDFTTSHVIDHVGPIGYKCTMSDASEQATRLLHDSMSLTATMGMCGVEAGPERVVIDMDWSDDLLTGGGLLHGGAIMALADSAGGALAFLNLPAGSTGTSTIESKTNFLGAVTEGHTVRATATPLHTGSTTIVVETELRVGDRLVAKVTQTQAVLRPRG